VEDGSTFTMKGGTIYGKSADPSLANSATVTLSGRLSLQSQFTVPAGVTLDLAGDDAALELQDGAVLTVNGTVKAGPEKVRLEDNASEGTINGSGTIQLKGKGNLLRVWGGDNAANKTLTLDGVTLAGVADNNVPLVDVYGDGSVFVMKSGKITGNTYIGGDWAGGGGVGVKGTFIMEGGAISGNTAKGSTDSSTSRGGGAFINGNSTFTMQGGIIYGKSDSLPTGTAPSLANSAKYNSALNVDDDSTAKWGTGGTYTKGGVDQTGGSDIGGTDGTLIAVPAN
jgi:hypothetical protein